MMKNKIKGKHPHSLHFARTTRPDEVDAFALDDEAESVAGEMLAEVTSAEHLGEDARNEEDEDERNGFYVVDFTVLDEGQMAES